MKDEIGARRARRALQSAGDAVADSLGVDVDDLASLTATAPEEIRSALVESLERGGAIQRLLEAQAAQEDEPGLCANQVCKYWVQSEGEKEVPSRLEGMVQIVSTGRQSFCSEGAAFACGCLFRMRETPPNSLDGETCQPVPEWAEAVRMLRREGLLEPDDFGRYNGTDFALRSNVAVVWWALVELLVETGRVERAWVEAGMPDRGEESRRAKKLLGFAEPLGKKTEDLEK